MTKEELIKQQSDQLYEQEQQLAVLQKTVEDLQEKNKRLYQDLKSSRAAGQHPAAHGLLISFEYDIYPDERKEFIIAAIKEVRKTVKDGSRRANVYDDLINNNPVANTAEKRADKIKSLLKGYRIMNAKIKKELADIDISVDKAGGNHLRLQYGHDDRYTYTIPATGSDGNRGGKQATADITRKFF